MTSKVNSYFRYPPTFEQDARWGLCVTGVGYCDVPPNSPFPANRHPSPYAYKWEKGRVLSDYHLLYIVGGEAEFESESTGKVKIEAGNVVLSFPGVWHRCRPVTEIGWNNYWVCANGEQLDRLVREGLIGPLDPILRTGLKDSIKAPFLELLDCVRKDEIGSAYLLAAKTMEVFAAVLMSAGLQSSDPNESAHGTRRCRWQTAGHNSDPCLSAGGVPAPCFGAQPGQYCTVAADFAFR